MISFQFTLYDSFSIHGVRFTKQQLCIQLVDGYQGRVYEACVDCVIIIIIFQTVIIRRSILALPPSCYLSRKRHYYEPSQLPFQAAGYNQTVTISDIAVCCMSVDERNEESEWQLYFVSFNYYYNKTL
jgi:hypothetical protein